MPRGPPETGRPNYVIRSMRAARIEAWRTRAGNEVREELEVNVDERRQTIGTERVRRRTLSSLVRVVVPSTGGSRAQGLRSGCHSTMSQS